MGHSVKAGDTVYLEDCVCKDDEQLSLGAIGKYDFIQLLAKTNDISYREAMRVYNMFTSLVVSQVSKGVDVKLRGFGNFTVKTRKGRNVQDFQGNPCWVDVHPLLTFSPSGTLSRALVDSAVGHHIMAGGYKGGKA